jgi:hypothetical protein
MMDECGVTSVRLAAAGGATQRAAEEAHDFRLLLCGKAHNPLEANDVKVLGELHHPIEPGLDEVRWRHLSDAKVP